MELTIYTNRSVQPVYRCRMAIAGNAVPLMRLRTDLGAIQPLLHSPATTEAAVMVRVPRRIYNTLAWKTLAFDILALCMSSKQTLTAPSSSSHLTQPARSPPHPTQYLPPIPRTRAPAPPLRKPTVTRRLSLPACVACDELYPPPIMIPLNRKAWARRAVAENEDGAASLAARLEGGVLARRRGRLLKPLRLM